jgi:arylsulfatase A-like enzyme
VTAGLDLDAVGRYVNNMDTAPTVLHALGIEPPAGWAAKCR